MSRNPIKSLANYSRFVDEVTDNPIVRRSTLAVWSNNPFTGTAEGEVWFLAASDYAYVKNWTSKLD